MSETQKYRLTGQRWRVVRQLFLDGRAYSFTVECTNLAYGLQQLDLWQQKLTGVAPAPSHGELQ